MNYRKVIVAGRKIALGHRMDNLATCVAWPVGNVLSRYGPGGTFLLTVCRPGESETYLASDVSLEDEEVHWIVSSSDTEIAGTGEAQLSYQLGEQVVWSRVISVVFFDSLPAASKQLGEVTPVPVQELISKAQASAEAASQSAGEAQASAEDAEGAAKAASESSSSAKQAAVNAAAAKKAAMTALAETRESAEAAAASLGSCVLINLYLDDQEHLVAETANFDGRFDLTEDDWLEVITV